MILRYLALGPVVAVICFVLMRIGGYGLFAAIGISWIVGSFAVLVLAVHTAYFRKPSDQAVKDKTKDVASSAVDNV